MGKHSSGEQNYSIAKGPLIGLLAVLLLVITVVIWLNVKSDNSADHQAANSQCSRGDLNLLVATDPANVGQVQKLVEAYGNSNPVVKDYCVRPQITVEGSQAILESLGKENTHGINVPPGVWIPADKVFVDRAKEQKRIAVEDPRAWLKPIQAGVAVRQDRADEFATSTWTQLAEQKIATPGDSDAALSAIANDALGGGTSAATMRAGLGAEFTANSLLSQIADGTSKLDGVAATKPMLDMAGKGLKLVIPDGSPQLNAPIVAFGSGGPITENVARASADFAKFAEQSDLANTDSHESSMKGTSLDLLPVLAGMKTDPQALPGSNPSSANAAAPAAMNGPGSSLVLVDASETVDIPAIARTVSPLLADAARDAGHRVAVWNYSSPQTEGVVNSVRSNVLFADGSNGVDDSVGTLNSISSVGKPWLWRSLQPTYEYAVATYAAGMPNRIVLITTGKDDSGDDAKQAAEAIKQLMTKEKPVAIEVVALKGATVSAELKELADATGGAVHSTADYDASLSKAVSEALGL